MKPELLPHRFPKPEPPPLRDVPEWPGAAREIRAFLYVCAFLVLAALVALAWSSPAFAQAPRYEDLTIPVENAAALALVPCAAGVQNGENERRLQRDTQQEYHCSELTVGGGFDWRLVTGDSGAGGLTDESVPFVDGGVFAEDAGLTWDGEYLAAPKIDVGIVENTTTSTLDFRAPTNIFFRFGVALPLRAKADYVGVSRLTLAGDLGLGPTAFLSLRGDGLSNFIALRSSGGTDGDVFIVDSSGNVGVNTLSPAVRLEVTGDAEVNGVLIVTSAEGACKFHGRFTVAPAPITACDSYWDIVAKDLYHWDGVAWAP